jgi:hypothetical protein
MFGVKAGDFIEKFLAWVSSASGLNLPELGKNADHRH